MVYYSVNSTSKIVHSVKCRYSAKIEAGNRKTFITLDEALANGYRLCKCCERQSQKETDKALDEIDGYFSAKMKFTAFVHKGIIYVTTPIASWRIYIRNGKYVLYHENTERIPYIRSEVPIYDREYHNQKVSFASVKKCMDYIIAHDVFKKKISKNRSLAKEMKRRRAIKNVYLLLEKIESADKFA